MTRALTWRQRLYTKTLSHADDASRVSRYGPDATTITPALLLEVMDLPEHELIIRRALEDEARNPDHVDHQHPYSGAPRTPPCKPCPPRVPVPQATASPAVRAAHSGGCPARVSPVASAVSQLSNRDLSTRAPAAWVEATRTSAARGPCQGGGRVSRHAHACCARAAEPRQPHRVCQAAQRRLAGPARARVSNRASGHNLLPCRPARRRSHAALTRIVRGWHGRSLVEALLTWSPQKAVTT